MTDTDRLVNCRHALVGDGRARDAEPVRRREGTRPAVARGTRGRGRPRAAKAGDASKATGKASPADGTASEPRAKPPRRRLDAATARARILDAAEKRLVVVGPSGIRLQDVAADAGIAHPTVLHHFGSREQLVQEVIARSLGAINAALVEAIRASNGGEAELESLLEDVAETLKRTGHGRVILWLALEGHPFYEGDVSLTDIVEATHTLRLARRTSKARPPRVDTARLVVLAALVLVGGSVLGPTMLAKAGLDGPGAEAGFRRWLARLLVEHLEHGG